MKKSLFWFRQDLRTFDNTGLIQAIEDSDEILPVFIMDENIIPDFLWLEDKKFLFLKEALLNLDTQLKALGGKLIIRHGKPEKIISELIEKYTLDAVYTNTSYSIYGSNRDAKIADICSEKKISFHQYSDYLMIEPDQIEQRKVFTPFYKLWQKQLALQDIVLQEPTAFIQLITDEVEAWDFLNIKIPGWKHPYFTIDFGQTRRKNFDFSSYEAHRNNLDIDGTSRLSVYLRFGIYSIRDIYLQAVEQSPTYISELAWREFWQHIAHYFPHTKYEAFQEKRRHIQWKHDEHVFQKWCDGETGYPVVDAAMKQLVETNWMHGRARMVVASFLTKDLLIDWKWWEAFFKKHLLDYDENVNYGNWQWSASIWADPKPLRIFSPLLQSEKFDPDARYIKKYLPGLQNESLKDIHNPLKGNLNYIPLIVDHSIAQREAREVYKNDDYLK